MSGSRQTSKGKYKIEYEEGAWQALSSFPESVQEKVFVLARDHLQHTPTQRIPGRLKELKGEYKGLYQFDVTKDARMIFSVDEDAKTVFVEYIGKHPEWKRRKSRAY